MQPTIAPKEVVTSSADGKSMVEICPSPTNKQQMLLELWQYNSFNPPTRAAIPIDLVTLNVLITTLQAARASLAATATTKKRR